MGVVQSSAAYPLRQGYRLALDWTYRSLVRFAAQTLNWREVA